MENYSDIITIKNEPKIRFIFIIYFINSKVFSVAFNLYLHPKGSVIIGVQWPDFKLNIQGLL